MLLLLLLIIIKTFFSLQVFIEQSIGVLVILERRSVALIVKLIEQMLILFLDHGPA
jgi:hypothetical protein